jgi:hypothetical protein
MSDIKTKKKKTLKAMAHGAGVRQWIRISKYNRKTIYNHLTKEEMKQARDIHDKVILKIFEE